MVTLTEGKHTAEHIAESAMGNGYHNDMETVLTGRKLVPGTVVGAIAASSKLTAIDLSKTDGTEVAIGVTYGTIDATAADAKGLITARGPITMVQSALTYPAGATAPNIAAINKQLLGLGIKVL